jgi:hypothetical protein
MTPSDLLSHVTDPDVIRDHLTWHEKQDLSVVLLMASCDSHVHAKVKGLDTDGSGLTVVCTGFGGVAPGHTKPYSLIGTTAKGANFMASGKMQPCSGSVDCFKLSLPECIEIAQSRDCHRTPAPAGHFLHFSASDPHLNDIVCKVKNVSLGGLAVVWDGREHCKPPMPGGIADDALLVGGGGTIQLGRLRVAHAVPRKHHVLLGLKFESQVPGEYGKLVLNAQRSQCFA